MQNRITCGLRGAIGGAPSWGLQAHKRGPPICCLNLRKPENHAHQLAVISCREPQARKTSNISAAFARAPDTAPLIPLCLSMSRSGGSCLPECKADGVPGKLGPQRVHGVQRPTGAIWIPPFRCHCLKLADLLCIHGPPCRPRLWGC